METYSQSSGTLSYDSHPNVDKIVGDQIRRVATRGTTFDDQIQKIVEHPVTKNQLESPQIVPVASTTLKELNRRHVRKPLYRVEQRMRIVMPDQESKFAQNSDLLELYKKTLDHFISSPMKKDKAFRLDVCVSLESARPTQFRLDLIALKDPVTKKTLSCASQATQSIHSRSNTVETIAENDFFSLRNRELLNAAERKKKQSHKDAERNRPSSKQLRADKAKYPENTGFGGMSVEKHVEKIRNSATAPKVSVKGITFNSSK
ncbi:hypothetical protein L596_009034 [Steinernema carpocapsae]|uniref:Uncharacterized protein n=1 Tax=Steinernema carpocapsae TaxID=34508 RepID=A0A4U5PER2_STECR|nr:hypothetical protein L596_009034 [Steinernema carpocapsae]